MTINTTKSEFDGERIAKAMARAGYCSRREAERWILEGRVKVNGETISSPALNVTAKDIISIDNEAMEEKPQTRLFIYHKPTGLVTTHSDPEGRATVFENLPRELGRLISVGRLDLTSEGLLLLTNDGGLARLLELPSTGFTRIYRARAFGQITQEELSKLENGIVVDGVKYGSIEAILERGESANAWIRLSLKEGKNREIRKVLAALGLTVNRLIRTSYGPFELGNLPRGEITEVSRGALKKLMAQLEAIERPKPVYSERAKKSSGQRRFANKTAPKKTIK